MLSRWFMRIGRSSTSTLFFPCSISRTGQVRRAGALVSGTPEFPSPFVFNNRDPITLVELRMRRFSGIIRAKPSWWEKVHDAELVAKWRAEMVEQDRVSVDSLWRGVGHSDIDCEEKKWPRDPLTDAQLDYIFAQLKYEADRRDPATGICVKFINFALLDYRAHPFVI